MSSSNALGWVFPPAGQDIPPLTSEVDFGPIHYKDSIVVEFTPSTYTGEIRLYCDWQNGMQGQVWTLTNTGSPLTYNFAEQTPNAQDGDDYHACHFFFASNTVSTSSGNTQAFQYFNNQTSQAVTWSSSGSSASGGGGGSGPVSSSSSSSSSTSSSSTSSSRTSTQTSTTTTATTATTGTTDTTTGTGTGTGPAQTTPTTRTSATTSPSTGTTGGAAGAAGANNTSSPDLSSQNNSSSGLGAGAIAGIVIGIVALIALLVGLGFFFGRRHRRNASQGPAPLPVNQGERKIQPMYNNDGGHGAYGGVGGAGAQQGQQMSEQGPYNAAWTTPQKGHYAPSQVRMGELAGNQVNELETRPVVHEMGGGYRNELPG